MRKVIKLFIVLVLAAIVIGVAIPFAVPVDTMKQTVLGKIEAATGRKVDIQTLSLSVFPHIALKAKGVSISNPAWAGADNMANIRELRLGVELMPLLHKQINITELTLESPVITLVKKGTQANWQFGAAAVPSSGNPAAVSKQDGGQGMNIIPSHIAIHDGTLVYKEMVSGTEQNISGLNLDLKAPHPSEKAVLDGSAIVNGQKAEVLLELGTPLTLMNGPSSDANLKLAYGSLKLSWQGTLALAHGVPLLTGTVTVPTLDITQLTGKKQPGRSGTAAAAAPAPSSRWSDAPIDWGALNNADISLTVAINRLVLQKTTLDNVELATHLSQGMLVVKTNDVAAYGGTIRLMLDVNTAGVASADAKVTGVKAEPLLTDFAGYDKLSGTMDAQLKLSSQGRTERALVDALSGQGSFGLKDGRLKGANIAGLVRNIRGQSGDGQSTDFSALSGTFTIKNGIASNNDLKMESPLLRVTGAGTADLPDWQVKYLLQPKLVSSLQGQGGQDLSGIVIPIRVEGPLDNPRYQPDLAEGIKQNPKIKNAMDKLKGNLGNQLQNLLR